MVGAGRMTEPNVLGNVSAGKFLFDTGNTEIITLWNYDEFGGNKSMMVESPGTSNGTQYIVPVGRVFYLLKIHIQYMVAATSFSIHRHTVQDSSAGTCVFRYEGTNANEQTVYDGMIKFNAGDYVNRVGNVSDGFFTVWGVECDV